MIRHHNAPCRPPAQQGFALLEVITAMLVLCMSFLSTALLLAQTAREERSALFMGRAAILANDMAERVRISPGARAFYAANESYAAASDDVFLPSYCGGLQTTPGQSPQVYGDCTTLQDTATYDITTWQRLVANTLPGGAGIIVPPSGTRTSHTVVIAWADPAIQRSSGGTPQRVNQACFNIAGANLNAPENVRCYAVEVRP